MKCVKCGSRLKGKEKFCTNCGYYNDSTNLDEGEEIIIDNGDDDFNLLDEEFDKVEETKEEQSEVKTNEESEMVYSDDSAKDEKFYDYQDEELLEAYIGEDYKVIKKMPFNVFAFLLNWGYVLYRKLYITGVIGLIITAIIITFFRKILIIYIIICMIGLGFLFNPYYIFISKRRINSLRNEYGGTDTFTLSNMCEERGGVNVVMALVFYFLFLLFVFFSTVTIHFNNNNNTKYWKENSENKATCMSLVKTAYNNLESFKIEGDIIGGTCKVIKTGTTSYNIYLKVKGKDDNVYVYLETEKDSLVYKHDTTQINDLELKKANDDITTEEETILNNLRQLEGNYNDIIKNDIEEDVLIKKKKNTSEKTNFSFTSDEIIR